jgi:hypothetical protein
LKWIIYGSKAYTVESPLACKSGKKEAGEVFDRMVYGDFTEDGSFDINGLTKNIAEKILRNQVLESSEVNKLFHSNDEDERSGKRMNSSDIVPRRKLCNGRYLYYP